MSVLAVAAVGPFVFIRSFAKLGFQMPALHLCKMDFFLSLKSLCCMEPSFLAFGWVCIGGALLALHTAELGSFVPTDNLVQTGCATSVVNSVHPEFPSSLHSFSRTESVMPSFDHGNVESSMLPRQYACLGSSAFTLGIACVGESMPVLGSAHVGLFSFLHSLS